MLEQTAAVYTSDCMNLHKLIVNRKTTVLGAIKGLLFFAPLTPHIEHPTENSGIAETVNHQRWEAVELSHKLGLCLTSNSRQYEVNSKDEILKIPVANLNNDTLLYSTYERSEAGQQLAESTLFETLRHHHGKSRDPEG